MTLRHLRIFLSVAETGNMTAAAEKLFMTQPPVSQCIKELESHYEVQLFDRVGRGIQITAAGLALQSYAAHILQLTDDAQRHLADLRNGGTVRIGTSMTVGSTFLPELVQEFTKEVPAATLYLVVDNTTAIIDQLNTASLDLAIIEGHGFWPALVAKKLCTNELVLVCHPDHHWATMESISLNDLQGQRFLVRETGSGTRESFAAAMQMHNISWELGGSINNAETIMQLVSVGQGVSFVPRHLAKAANTLGSVAVIQVHGLNIKRDFTLVYHRNKLHNSALAKMIEIAEALGQANSNQGYSI